MNRHSDDKHFTEGKDSSHDMLRLTIFKNFAATSLETNTETLAKLRDRILAADAATKHALPWLKLASFGNKPTESKCLRHDANVTGIDGIELDYDGKDYDGKPVSFDAALVELNSVGVRGLLYTSPSHTAASPRWRILMPTSKQLQTDMRAKLVARINGRLGNIFAPESFKLSQSYYYGRAKDNPAADHRAEIIEGDYIDLRDDLYKFQGAGAKTNKNDKPHGDGNSKNAYEQHGEQYGSGGHGYEAYLAKVGDGPGLEGFNEPLCQASSSYAAQHGVDLDRGGLKAILRQAINDAPKAPNRKAADIKKYLSNHYLDNLIETAIKKYGSATGPDDGEAAAAADGNPRPIIQVLAHEGPAVAKRAEEILLNLGAEIYQRGGLLVRHVIEEADASHGRKTKVARLIEITPVYLRNELGKAIRWHRYDKRAKKWLPSAVPPDVAPVILSQVGHWTFPTISGVITTPTMRPDGSLLLEAGYDEATRLLLVAPPVMPIIPDAPTRDDAKAALALLEDLLTEFPFDDDNDKTDNEGKTTRGKKISLAVALSGLISPVVRGAFPVVPLHVSRAPIASSGKSYLWDIAASIAIGRLMPVTAAGKSEEETEKRLGAALLAGQPLISIDNVNGELAGDALCQIIERPTVNIRILGKSELVSVEARSTSVFCTGNNIVLVGDLVRRAIITSLDPELEKPELKVFGNDPVAMVLADRGKYIAACLTICRAYLVAGRPNKAGRLASFEGWSDTVRSALIWLGKADPVASIDASRAEDPERIQLREMLTAWADKIGFRVNKTLAQVIKVSEEINQSYGNLENPALRDALQAAVAKKNGPPGPRGQQVDAGALGQWLRGRKGRILGGLRFASKTTKGHSAVWWVEHKDGATAEAKYSEELKGETGEQEKQDGTGQEANGGDKDIPFC
jgi:hypothetical protein